MGHWSVFCAVTHTPITCGRCVAVWTKPDRYDDGFNPENIHSIFYRGEYDTYGRLEFDGDQPYLDHLTNDELDTPSMFISEVVFDKLMDFSVDRYGHGIGDGSAYASADITPYTLELLGFERSDPDKLINIFHDHVFCHETEPAKKLYSDGRSIKLLDSGQEVPYIYYFKDFEKHFPSVDYGVIKNMSSELCYIRSKVWQYNFTRKKYSVLEAITGEDSFIKSFREETCRHLGITEVLFQYINDENFQVELAKAMRVRKFMYANNLKFGYRFWGGPQDGNIQAHDKLVELVKLANADYHENCDYDEDE